MPKHPVLYHDTFLHEEFLVQRNQDYKIVVNNLEPENIHNLRSTKRIPPVFFHYSRTPEVN